MTDLTAEQRRAPALGCCGRLTARRRSMKETRKYRVLRGISEMGKSRIYLECPYCQTKVWGYLWSMAGSGKKCPGCGAIHTMFGSVKESSDERNVLYHP